MIDYKYIQWLNGLSDDMGEMPPDGDYTYATMEGSRFYNVYISNGVAYMIETTGKSARYTSHHIIDNRLVTRTYSNGLLFAITVIEPDVNHYGQLLTIGLWVMMTCDTTPIVKKAMSRYYEAGGVIHEIKW